MDWDDELLTGDRVTDTHHRAFFVKAQRFMVATQLGRGSEELQETVGFLRQYAQHHFAVEERRMEESGFPYARSHKEAHRAFVATIDEVQERIDAGADKDELAVELSKFVVDWFRHHIRNADFPLIQHIRGET